MNNVLKKRLYAFLLVLGISLSFTSIVSVNSVSAANVNTWASSSEFNNISLDKGYKDLNQGNPCMTQRFTADPGVMEYNGRVYVYTTNDEYMYSNGQVTENNYSNIKTINCMSSSDMVNWTDHGSINVAGNTGAAKWAACSWAPTAAHKTINGKEKFFLYRAISSTMLSLSTLRWGRNSTVISGTYLRRRRMTSCWETPFPVPIFIIRSVPS